MLPYLSSILAPAAEEASKSGTSNAANKIQCTRKPYERPSVKEEKYRELIRQASLKESEVGGGVNSFGHATRSHAFYIKAAKDSIEIRKQLLNIRLKGYSAVVRALRRFGPETEAHISIWKDGMVTMHTEKGCETHYISQLLKFKYESLTMHVTWSNKHWTLVFSNLPELEAFVDTLNAHLTKFKRRKVQLIKHLVHLQRIRNMTFSPEDGSHKALLDRLWRAIFAEHTSENWRWMGFQGTNPASDFRGMGLLSLYLMTYLAESRPEYCRTICEASRLSTASEREYPWATAGINICAMIIRHLGLNDTLMQHPPSDPSWSSPLLDFMSNLDTEDDSPIIGSELSPGADLEGLPQAPNLVVEELFVYLIELLDILFVRAKAKYMDFPEIMTQMEDKFLLWIRGSEWTSKSLTMQDLYDHMREELPPELDDISNPTTFNTARVATSCPPPSLNTLTDLEQDYPWDTILAKMPYHLDIDDYLGENKLSPEASQSHANLAVNRSQSLFVTSEFSLNSLSPTRTSLGPEQLSPTSPSGQALSRPSSRSKPRGPRKMAGSVNILTEAE